MAAVMENKDVVRNFFVEGYVRKNYSYVLECMADNYIDHSPAGARSNVEAVNILKAVEGIFKDLKIEILELFGEGEMVATRIRFEGINVGEYIGVQATGKKVCFEALENFKVVDGKIVESWGYWPDLGILNQLKDQ